jgi:thymidylate synthase
LEIIAKEVNMVPDELIGSLGDTHLYLNHIEQAKEQIGRELSFKERRDLMVKYTQDNNLLPIPYMIPFGEESKKKYLEVCDKYNIAKRTREPYPLPKLKLDDWYSTQGDVNNSTEVIMGCLMGLNHGHITLKNYQSHPTIKAPLSN